MFLLELSFFGVASLFFSLSDFKTLHKAGKYPQLHDSDGDSKPMKQSDMMIIPQPLVIASAGNEPKAQQA